MVRMLMAFLLLFQAGCAAALAGDGPSGRDYILAIYLDRPAVTADRANAAIADAARIAVTALPPPRAHYAPQAAPVH